MAGQLADEGNQLAQRVHVRATEGIFLPDRRVVGERMIEAMRDIAHEDGLESRLRGGDRHHRKMALERGEQVEEPILAAEDHRRLENRPVEPRGDDRRLRFALAPQVPGRPLGIGIERAHLHEAAHAGGAARGDDLLRELRVHARERVAARLVQDADEIDDRRGAGGEPRERRGVVDVAFDHVDGRQQDEVTRGFAPARGHDHALARAHEPAHQMTADEAAAAQHQNGLGSHRHGTLAAIGETASAPAGEIVRGGTIPRRVDSGTYGCSSSRA